jgi:hypothetical protein
VAFVPPVKPDSAWLQARTLKEAALGRYKAFAAEWLPEGANENSLQGAIDGE